ncbi:MAG: hypothetical protein AAF215_04495 [Cyanobacteria bacterium P01_A01_bin.123]
MSRTNRPINPPTPLFDEAPGVTVKSTSRQVSAHWKLVGGKLTCQWLH